VEYKERRDWYDPGAPETERGAPREVAGGPGWGKAGRDTGNIRRELVPSWTGVGRAAMRVVKAGRTQWCGDDGWGRGGE